MKVELIEKYEFLLERLCTDKSNRLLKIIRDELKRDGLAGSEAWSRVMFDNTHFFEMITVDDVKAMDSFHIEF